MAQVINPGERQDNELAQALSIAERIFGVVMDQKQKKAAESLAQKRLDADIEANKIAQQKETKKNAAAFEGDYVPIIGNEKPTDGTPIIGLSNVPEGVNVPAGATGYRKPAAKENPYQALQVEMQQTRLAMQQESNERQKEKMRSEATRRIAETVQKTGAVDLVTSLKKLDKAIPGGIEGSDADGDIPGIGGAANAVGIKDPIFGLPVGKVFTPALSEEGKNVRQLVANVRNALLKARSGGAVTDPEAERFMEELGQGLINTDEDLRRGLRIVKDNIRANLEIIESGTDPDVLNEFASRKGSIISSDPFFDNFNRNKTQTAGNRGGASSGWGTATAAPNEPSGFDPDSFLKGR